MELCVICSRLKKKHHVEYNMEPTQDKNVRFSIEQILTTAKRSYIRNWNNQIKLEAYNC